MMPWSRSPLPLLQFKILRSGSRPRSRHAFQIQRCSSKGPKREGEGFPYNFTSWHLPRKVLLKRLRFPREYMPIHRRIWWTMRWTPQLMYVLVNRMWNPRPSTERCGEVKSRIGRSFYNFVIQKEVQDMLNLTMLPWGYFHSTSGPSMQPTLGCNPAILYGSYAYVDSRDVRLGDVVTVVKPDDKDKDQRTWCKRIAALERDRIWVNPGQSITKYTLSVNNYCFSLLSSVSC